MLIYAGIKGMYDSKVAYIVVYIPIKFEKKDRLKIKEIIGQVVSDYWISIVRGDPSKVLPKSLQILSSS